MNSYFKTFLVAVGLTYASLLFAADKGTTVEAEAMAKKAVAFVKANGPEKSAVEFTTSPAFKDRDLYVVYTKFNGDVLAHGGNPKLVGKNLVGMKDSEGNPFFQMLLDLAKSKGKGWSGTYRFLNPTTQTLESKIMYVESIGDTYVGVGIYK